jgi:ABC-2 type transport system ATP-binding protein
MSIDDQVTVATRGVHAPASEVATLRGVTKRFKNADGAEFTAVDGLDLRIQQGEVLAFLGPNGAGKTTTIDMLLGLTSPDDGTVALFGQDPQQAVRAGRVAAVLQSGGLLPDLTVEATVRMLGSLYPNADADGCMARAGVDKLRARKVSACSGGEQQRLRFAIALLSHPEFLVLDEPTAGMDVTARREFWAAVRADAARGMTVMFATHYLEEADQFADRIVMLDQGKVVADGSASSIRSAVTGRTVSARMRPTDAAAFATLPGVRLIETRGDRHYFECADTDALVGRRIGGIPAEDVEITPRSLEEAFITITNRSQR